MRVKWEKSNDCLVFLQPLGRVVKLIIGRKSLSHSDRLLYWNVDMKKWLVHDILLTWQPVITSCFRI